MRHALVLLYSRHDSHFIQYNALLYDLIVQLDDIAALYIC